MTSIAERFCDLKSVEPLSPLIKSTIDGSAKGLSKYIYTTIYDIEINDWYVCIFETEQSVDLDKLSEYDLRKLQYKTMYPCRLRKIFTQDNPTIMVTSVNPVGIQYCKTDDTFYKVNMFYFTIDNIISSYSPKWMNKCNKYGQFIVRESYFYKNIIIRFDNFFSAIRWSIRDKLNDTPIEQPIELVPFKTIGEVWDYVINEYIQNDPSYILVKAAANDGEIEFKN